MQRLPPQLSRRHEHSRSLWGSSTLDEGKRSCMRACMMSRGARQPPHVAVIAACKLLRSITHIIMLWLLSTAWHQRGSGRLLKILYTSPAQLVSGFLSLRRRLDLTCHPTHQLLLSVCNARVIGLQVSRPTVVSFRRQQQLWSLI